MLISVVSWLPVIFGVGFLGPVVAALVTVAGIDAPFGLTPIQLGLVAGLIWGAIAKFGGRWV
ncbi:MAG: hypothetical protein FD160_788 [Caulobacteraceae bacterium]|nr:MAG: hypothetical protein FD160_788 [Caulobacteraceae bacterium]